jgi:hypothetical protein
MCLTGLRISTSISDIPWWATVLLEGSNSKDPCLEQALGLHLNCMTEPLGINKGHDADSHGEASLAFSVIFGQCS